MAEIVSLAERAALERDIPEIVKARIPRRFWSATFDNFEQRTSSQSAAWRAVKAWLDLVDNGKTLALVGQQGTGKSHLLYAAANALLRGRRAAYVRPWYRFVDDLRYGTTVSSEGGTRTREAAEVRADWWSAPVVLLDEVRKTSGTTFDADELAKFACMAYDEQRSVLLTTNTPLEEVMGAPAASRFAVVNVIGPDGRKAVA